MSGLEDDLNDKQRLYRDIFTRARDALVEKLQSIQGRENKLDFLKNQVSKDILLQIQGIRTEQGRWNCAMCGTCCRIASSEFTHSELKQKASEGDVFAKSFTEVFVPYEDKSRAEAEFPDYIALLKERNLFDETNFYYCPKLSTIDETGCYLCSDYASRPQVCRDFPNNPLVIFPPKCAFNAWKDEFEVQALFLNAMIEIVGYFIEELDC